MVPHINFLCCYRHVQKISRTRRVVEENQVEVLKERYGIDILKGEFPDDTVVISLKRFKRKYVPSNGSVYKVWRINPSGNVSSNEVFLPNDTIQFILLPLIVEVPFFFIITANSNSFCSANF